MARTQQFDKLNPMTSTRTSFGTDYAAATARVAERQSLGITAKVLVERGTDPRPYQFCYVLEAN